MIKIGTCTVIAILVIGLWLFWAFHTQQIAYFALGNIFVPSQAASWGDAFGAYNALISSLGLVFLVATLLMQGRAISEQQKDQHRQRFESTLFQLFGMIRESRSQIKFRHSDDYLARYPKRSNITHVGHTAFLAAFRELQFRIREAEYTGEKIDKSTLSELYIKYIHKNYAARLGAYYRLVYGTLNRISSDKMLTDTEKDDIGNLIRGQFSSSEVALAGCNGLNAFAKDFDNLIIRFRLLKYAKEGPIYDILLTHYPLCAFQGRNEPNLVVPEGGNEDDDH